MIASHACGVSWVQRGSQTGHCCACHLTFASEQAFDAHRVTTPAGRGCIDPADCKRLDGSPALVQKHDGHGIVWSRVRPEGESRPAHWARPDEPSNADTALPLVSVPDVPQSTLEGECGRSLG